MQICGIYGEENLIWLSVIGLSVIRIRVYSDPFVVKKIPFSFSCFSCGSWEKNTVLGFSFDRNHSLRSLFASQIIFRFAPSDISYSSVLRFFSPILFELKFCPNFLNGFHGRTFVVIDNGFSHHKRIVNVAIKWNLTRNRCSCFFRHLVNAFRLILIQICFVDNHRNRHTKMVTQM